MGLLRWCVLPCAAIFALLATDATAAPPTSYACGPGGKPLKKEERCTCPAGKGPRRDAKGAAVCVATTRGKLAPVTLETRPAGAVVDMLTGKGERRLGVTPLRVDVPRTGQTALVITLEGHRRGQRWISAEDAGRTHVWELDPIAHLSVLADVDPIAAGARVLLECRWRSRGDASFRPWARCDDSAERVPTDQRITFPLSTPRVEYEARVTITRSGYAPFVQGLVASTPGQIVSLSPTLVPLADTTFRDSFDRTYPDELWSSGAIVDGALRFETGSRLIESLPRDVAIEVDVVSPTSGWMWMLLQEHRPGPRLPWSEASGFALHGYMIFVPIGLARDSGWKTFIAQGQEKSRSRAETLPPEIRKTGPAGSASVFRARLKVVRRGPRIDLFVDDMTTPLLTHEDEVPSGSRAPMFLTFTTDPLGVSGGSVMIDNLTITHL